MSEHDHGLPDSGDRTPQYGGAMRDRAPGKGRFDLLSPFFLQALARLAEQGAAKYAHRNWERGYSTALCADSLMRHATQYLAGNEDEDHLAAIAWNAMAAWHVTRMVEQGHLPPSLVNHLPFFVNGNLPPCDAEHPDYPGVRCTLGTGHDGPFHQHDGDDGTGIGWPMNEDLTVTNYGPIESLAPEDRAAELMARAPGWIGDDFEQARAIFNAVRTIKETGGAVEIAGVKIQPCDEYGLTEEDRARHDIMIERCRLDGCPFGHAVGQEVCARCRRPRLDHGPEKARSGCDYLGPGTRSSCNYCGCEIRWDGRAWRDNHPGETAYCHQSKDPDAGHVPAQAGDLRG
jgi:hypothetical protein